MRSVESRVRRARRLVLFLDFDGTLAAIRRRPEEAFLSPTVAKALRGLASSGRFWVVIISGRRLADVRARARVRGVIYIGNHGMEIKGLAAKAIPSRLRQALSESRIMARVAAHLKRRFEDFDGVQVENKRHTVSVHYRRLARARIPQMRRLIRRSQEVFGSEAVVWRRGKEVVEVRPQSDWHKGDAAAHVMRSFAGALPIALGDDRTDEDMFAVLRRRGITIRVGSKTTTNSEYFVCSQAEVEPFLHCLLNWVTGKKST